MKRMLLILCLLLLSHPGYCSFKHAMGYGLTMVGTESTRTIRSVLEGSPAAKACLKESDLILSVNGKATSGLTNEAIIALLKEKEKAVLVVERAGTSISVSMSKAPLYTFDRKCLSGNCIDGKGRAVFVGNDMQYEATFSDGEITGPCKMYDKTGSLVYEGMVINRKAYGAGKMYRETEDKKRALLSEGTYVNDIIATGTLYDESGLIKSSGTFDADGWISSGINELLQMRNKIVNEMDFPER